MQFLMVITFLLLPIGAYTKTICFAHRGGGWNYFDNSISAFKGALEEKFEGVETDLHQTKDGQIILLHDDNLSEVAIGPECPLDKKVEDLNLLSIKKNCKLKNGDDITTLEEVLNLLKPYETLVILDLKEQLTDHSIVKILEAGIPTSRMRLTAFFPEFLRNLPPTGVLSKEQTEAWNSIPRYENFRHPVFSNTKFNKNFHLFSAFTYAQLNSEDRLFGAWEVNYPFS